MLEAMTERLEAHVPRLEKRVSTATDFSRLKARGVAPSGGLNAYLIPSGIQAGASDLMAGAFRQELRRGVTLVLLMLASDPVGTQALDDIPGLLDECLQAICGWAPGEQSGVFELASARFATAEKGLISYLIDFRINDQLRVTT